MTSRSRRKRPITAPSTRARKAKGARLGASVAAAVLAFACCSAVVAAESDDLPLAHLARAKASPTSIARSYAPPGPQKLRWRPYHAGLAPVEDTASLAATGAGEKTIDRQVVQAKAEEIESTAANRERAVQTAAAQVGLDEPGDGLELGPADSGSAVPAPGSRRLRTLTEDDLPDQPLPAPSGPGGDMLRPPGSLDSQSSNDCEEYKADCRAAWESLQKIALADITLDIAVAGAEGSDFPCNCLLGEEVFQPRAWTPLTFTWKASGLCHKPLYFEDVHLERYGHSWNPLAQPFLSAAHFFVNVPLLPYHMGIDPPNECQYSLGYYRPGNCAPYLIDPIPISLRGGLFQAGAIIGAAAIIP